MILLSGGEHMWHWLRRTREEARVPRGQSSHEARGVHACWFLARKKLAVHACIRWTMNLTCGVDRYRVCKKVKLKGGNKIFWKWNEKVFFFFIILERINFRILEYEFFGQFESESKRLCWNRWTMQKREKKSLKDEIIDDEFI